MREIKFRGFSEQQNKWIYGGYHKPFEDITQIIENVKNNASQMSIIKNGTEGQFTGLKDKNGVDIYEFDILDNGYNAKGMVYFKNGMFVVNFTYTETLLTKDNQTAFFRLCNVNMVTKIIGNIHEHPNLLK